MNVAFQPPVERLRSLVWVRSQHMLLALLLGAFLVAACSTPQRGISDPGGRPVSQAAAQAAVAPPSARPSVITEPDLLPIRDMNLVYRLVLERYVDRVDHTTLVETMLQAIRDKLLEDGALPLDTAPLDLVPLGSSDPDADWLTFAGAYQSVTVRYRDWALEKRVDYLALRRLIESLSDSHSLFMTPDEVARRNETSYSGIGVKLTKPGLEQPPLVTEVFDNSPASAAGIRPGDRISEVEGRATATMSIGAIVDLIRGPEGTEVTLKVQRQGEPSPLQFSVRRAPVQVASAEGYMVDSVAYIRLRQFDDSVAPLVREALVRGSQLGATGWIIDLRGNAGGSLEAVQRVAGLFLGSRPIGYRVDRSRRREAVNALGTAMVQPNVPKVVLVDRDTGSGAEILAAALREYQVARLVGTTTSGSVGVAQVFPLSDGSAVQLTVQRFLSASGQQLERVGVRPDEAVDMTESDLVAQRDPQLERALQVLSSRPR